MVERDTDLEVGLEGGCGSASKVEGLGLRDPGARQVALCGARSQNTSADCPTSLKSMELGHGTLNVSRVQARQNPSGGYAAMLVGRSSVHVLTPHNLKMLCWILRSVIALGDSKTPSPS